MKNRKNPVKKNLDQIHKPRTHRDRKNDYVRANRVVGGVEC